MTTKISWKHSLLALAVASTSMATQAQNSNALEEVVVTAQFREQNVQDTPLAITAISGETLELRSQASVTDIAAQAPNVTLAEGAAFGGNSLTAYIRGVGQTDFIPAVEPGVGIYVDDVYFASITGSVLQLVDVERIEVLRGPQGTLAGKNSVGGAIKMYSKRPSEEEDGFVEIGFGNYDAVKVRGASNFTLVPGTLFGRISGVSSSRDGHVTNLDYACVHPDSGYPSNNQGTGCAIGSEGGIDYTAARVALRWMPNDKLDVNFSVNIVDEDSEPAPNIPVFVGPSTAPIFDTNGLGVPFTLWDNAVGLPTVYGGAPYTGPEAGPGCLFVRYGPDSCDPAANNDMYSNYATYGDPRSGLSVRKDRTLESTDLALNIDYQMSEDMNLVSITSWREFESGWGQDEDGTNMPLAALYEIVESEAFSQEFRLNFSTGENTDWTVGAFYHEAETPVTGRIALGYVGFDFIHGPDPTNTETWAVFANSDISLNDKLTLNLGIRYSDDKKDYLFQRHNAIDGSNIQPCIGPPGTPGNPSNCLISEVNDSTASFSDSRLDYRLALTYEMSEDTMAYASWSTGYKGGGINPRPFYNVQIVTVDPEELETFEIGVKSDFLDKRMRTNAAIFYNDYTEVQNQFSVCPQFGAFAAPCLATLNAGDAEMKGLELEVDFAVSDTVTIDGSYSYLDFEWQTIAAGASVLPSGITPFTPETTWSMGIQYMNATQSGTMFARLDAAYQDDMWTDAENSHETLIESRTLLNASMSWTTPDEKWKAKLEVKNLTDKEYFGYIQAGHGLGVGYAAPALPRTYMVTLRREFF